ncbi:hypothetical protein FQA39_LY14343 [Lamprigera yunnana]|nr:hypothetical protein FQA39_LY14343 [Lamprigera yunnana]
MKILICVLVLVSVAHARRIVGGDDAEIADFPYQISLEVDGAHSCGGTILNPTKILTAAHCTQQFALNSLTVRAGSSLREEGGQVVNLLRKIEHPDYDLQTADNDVAVVILAQPLELNAEVQTIAISYDDDVPIGTLATLTGWGVTETGQRAKHLQKLLVPRAEDDLCKDFYGTLYKTETQTCYGGIRGQSACSRIALNSTEVRWFRLPCYYQSFCRFALNSLTVRAGSSLREEGGQVVNLLRKIEHPDYDLQTADNDVAVVILARRIVGGDDAEIADFPYQISLEVDGAHSCGGTILNPTKILTAAHCTQQFALNSLTVRAGSSLREEGGQVVNLLRKIEHPDYDLQTADNDVAVVILAQPLELNAEVQTIAISYDDDVPIGTLATLTGWGVTETGQRAKHLQKLLVPRAEDDLCKDFYGTLYKTETQTCYGGIRGQSACSSDSGGPIVVGVRQVGVVSYGAISCDGSSPGVYVKLFAFRDWIINTN